MARRSGFAHSNPVFDRTSGFNGTAPSAEVLQGMYDAPSASPAQTQRLTLDDVVMKSAISFGLLILVAATSYFALPDTASFVAVLPGLVVGLVLGLVISFKQSTNPALVLAYAVAEGFVVGGISRIYGNQFGDGLVTQAVLGTLCAVVGMLALYATGTLRATPRFTKTLMTAGLGYLALSLVSLVSRFFGVGDGWGLFGLGGGIGVLLCVAGVALASFFLILDFDFVDRGIRAGVPARFAWLAAAGLMMTVVWLYLEMLRLLAMLQRN